MALYVGIDTSNYTTSVAVYDSLSGRVEQQKKLLPVGKGKLGLKQSDAVFLHTKQMGDLLELLLLAANGPLDAVAASGTPRDEEGSYMPCFLVGTLVARAIAATAKIPFYETSHQAGHIMAALYSSRAFHLVKNPFLAFHFSGGTSQALLVEPDKENIITITTVAETLDLNAGQAVDRVGNMLGVGFPAGVALEKLALASNKYYKPKPTLKGKDCCLSGLENQCRKLVQENDSAENIARYCLDYLTSTILEMTRRLRQEYPGLPLVYAGGVMSNSIIQAAVKQEFDAWFATPEYSCDNAAGAAILCCMQHGGDLSC